MTKGRNVRCMAGIFSLALGLSWTSVQAGTIEEELRAMLQPMQAQEMMTVIVEMADHTDPRDIATRQRGADRATRRRAVVEELQERAQTTQGRLLAYLRQQQRAGNVARFTPRWITNTVTITATAEVIEAIAARDDVAMVRPNRPVSLPTPIPARESDASATSVAEPGITKIRAPEVWSTFTTGTGAVVGIIDSGVDVNHPDLSIRWRGGTNSWLDMVNGLSVPYDDNNHGTHVAGTAVGGNAGGSDIGVAPGAQWIACKGLDAVGSGFTSDLLDCMEWMLDPDGDPSTDDAPDVVNNSWGTSPGCFKDFEAAVNAWIAADIFPAFAAGNSGPRQRTGGSPAVYATAFAVGATNNNDVITGFSSRGRSSCDNTTFPEVTAPGANVRSAKPGTTYQNLSGTSMATPHVSGCVALMRSHTPSLAVQTISDTLKNTAVDRGTVGADNAYGWGRIDCFKAVSQ